MHDLRLCACDGFNSADCADFACCKDQSSCRQLATYGKNEGLHSEEYKHSTLAMNCFWGKTFFVHQLLVVGYRYASGHSGLAQEYTQSFSTQPSG